MRRFRRAGRAIAAASACGIVLHTPVSASAADGPTLILDPCVCASEYPYGWTAARVTGFPPDERIGITGILWFPETHETWKTALDTDGTGAGSLGGIGSPEPVRTDWLFFRDINRDYQLNRGEDVVAGWLTFNFDQPCEGGVAQPK